MMIPVRCFTCGSVVASAYEAYRDLVASGTDNKAALDEVGLERFCCRRMIVSHRDLIKDAALYD